MYLFTSNMCHVLMSVFHSGGKRTLKLPPELAYGVRGAGCKGGMPFCFMFASSLTINNQPSFAFSYPSAVEFIL